jgi:hypothetical protein
LNLAALDVENDMIRIEITLSTNRLNADRDWDDRFDPQDYASKLAEHLRPKLEDVAVIVPEKCAAHLDMTDMLARRIVEAVKAFHETAPDHVLRLSPQRFFRAG